MKNDDEIKKLELKIRLLSRKKTKNRLQLATQAAKPILAPFKKYIKRKGIVSHAK